MRQLRGPAPQAEGSGGGEVKYDVPAGDPGKPCRGCGHNIHWIKTRAGAWMPINWDGTPHWETCPSRDQFKRRPEVRKLDVDQVKKTAKGMGISDHAAAKRLLDYRAASSTQRCGNCEHMVVATFRGRGGMQCDVVGVADESDAWVSDKNVCDAHARGKTPRRW